MNILRYTVSKTLKKNCYMFRLVHITMKTVYTASTETDFMKIVAT